MPGDDRKERKIEGRGYAVDDEKTQVDFIRVLFVDEAYGELSLQVEDSHGIREVLSLGLDGTAQALIEMLQEMVDIGVARMAAHDAKFVEAAHAALAENSEGEAQGG